MKNRVAISAAVWVLALQTARAAAPYLEVAKFAGDRICAVSLTFDDGTPGQLVRGVKTLDKYGLRATFFINTAPVETSPIGSWMTWDAWKAAAETGHEIGSHTKTHVSLLQTRDTKRVRDEVVGAADLIAERIGVRPISFAYPFSEASPEAEKLVLETYTLDRSHCRIWGGERFTAARGIRNIEQALEKGEWFFCMLHGIDEQTFSPITQADLEAIAAYLASHRDKIWTDTYGNVGRYIRERGAAQIVTKVVEGGFGFRLLLTGELSHPETLTVPLTVRIPLDGHPADRVAISQGPATLTPTKGRRADELLVDVVPGSDWVTVLW